MSPLHLPDVMYGGLDTVADLIDERGADVTPQELSGAIVNIARAVASNLRTIDKLAARLEAIEGHVRSLLDLHVQQVEVNKSGTKVTSALEELLVTRSANLQTRLEAVEADLAQWGGKKP